VSARRLVVPQRGRVYLAPLGPASDAENKFWLCVSNNERNPRLDEFIAVRLTTTRRPRLPTWVSLAAQDQPWTGSVACDDLGPIYRDQVIKDAGALSNATMRRVDRALLIVLGIDAARASA
jgi:mRNA interferase MazF